jgi:hypothetical protein
MQFNTKSHMLRRLANLLNKTPGLLDENHEHLGDGCIFAANVVKPLELMKYSQMFHKSGRLDEST